MPANHLSTIPPFRIEPLYVTRVWGVHDLHPWFDYVTAGDPVGEVWLTGDECRVATGQHTGKRLADTCAELGSSLLGQDMQGGSSPLLIKVLFAREKLSVQVHPDDDLARKSGLDRGKTECWYALSAEAGARVALGLKPGSSIDQIREEIRTGRLEESLAELPVERGDMIFVDAGTVHAVWPGSVLLEIQQNCDITYRMYDYGRPRELHIEQSLEAMRLETRAGKVPPRQCGDRTLLLDERYFRIERVPVKHRLKGASLHGAERKRKLAYLFAAQGSGRIAGEEFDAIDLPPRGIVAIPAAAPEFEIENLGDLDLIRITPTLGGSITKNGASFSC